MSSAPTPHEIARDARWLAQGLDEEANVRLVEMSREAYRAASFLDDRMFHQPLNAITIRWGQVQAALGRNYRADARWIFHIGHVGSTLVARLLGEIDGVLSIREPRILRDVAAMGSTERSSYVPTLKKLFSRGFGPADVALVKATSFVSEIAAELIPVDGRALFMFAQPRAYIASILAGENSRRELHVLAASRAERMGPRGLSPGIGQSDAHLAAAAWACEMTSLEAAAERLGTESVLWLDFDRMLEDMAGSLGEAAQFLGVPSTSERIAEIASGPLMRRYSKALEYEYSPALRRELLAEAGSQHSSEIDEAVGLLEKAATGSPLLQRALSRSAPEA